MNSKNEIEKRMINDAIEQFSNNYIDKIVGEKMTNYSIEDIRTAFVKGAEWMKDFLDVKNMLWSKLI